jgi:hemerythrin-like domain-containing protein
MMQIPPLHTTIQVIQEEHDCLAAVINGMQHFVRYIEITGNAPDLKVFRAMLLYISDYPEKMHHPKEDSYLFSRLIERSPTMATVIAELELQHAQGEALVRGLEHALLRYELLGASAFAEFASLVNSYAEFYFRHMKLEETVILPAAIDTFNAADWQALDVAFAQNRNPLCGVGHGHEYEKLFSLITTIAPAPIGIGPALD